MRASVNVPATTGGNVVPNTYRLVMHDGRIVYIPMRRHDPDAEGGKAWWSIDWDAYKIGDCERCDGHPIPATGGCNSSAGLLTILVNAKPSTRDGLDVPGGYRRVVAACGCAFGAWRHQPPMSLPYADDLVPELRGLSGDEWAALLQAANAPERDGVIEADYATLARKMPPEQFAARAEVMRLLKLDDPDAPPSLTPEEQKVRMRAMLRGLATGKAMVPKVAPATSANLPAPGAQATQAALSTPRGVTDTPEPEKAPQIEAVRSEPSEVPEHGWFGGDEP